MKKTTKFAAIVFAVAASLFAAISLSACGDDEERVEPERPDPESIVGERVTDAAAWEAAFDFTGIKNLSMFMWESDSSETQAGKWDGNKGCGYNQWAHEYEWQYFDVDAAYEYTYRKYWLKQKLDQDDIDEYNELGCQLFIEAIGMLNSFRHYDDYKEFVYDEEIKAYIRENGDYVKITNGKISVIYDGDLYLQIYNIGTTVVKIPDEVVKNAVEK